MWPALLAAAPGIASAFGGVAGLFGNHHKTNPATAANAELNKISGQVKPYYDPYINAGRGALSDLQQRYQQQLNNPGELYNQLGAGYKESPGYANTMRAALTGVGNANAAGGTLGTPMHQQNAAETAGNVANKDFESYLNHIFGLYGQGLEGEQGLNTQGYDASSSMGNILGSVTGQRAQNAFTGQQGENAGRAQNWSNIFGGLQGANQGYNNYNQTQNLMDWLKANQLGAH